MRGAVSAVLLLLLLAGLAASLFIYSLHLLRQSLSLWQWHRERIELSNFLRQGWEKWKRDGEAEGFRVLLEKRFELEEGKVEEVHVLGKHCLKKRCMLLAGRVWYGEGEVPLSIFSGLRLDFLPPLDEILSAVFTTAKPQMEKQGELLLLKRESRPVGIYLPSSANLELSGRRLFLKGGGRVREISRLFRQAPARILCDGELVVRGSWEGTRLWIVAAGQVRAEELFSPAPVVLVSTGRGVFREGPYRSEVLLKGRVSAHVLAKKVKCSECFLRGTLQALELEGEGRRKSLPEFLRSYPRKRFPFKTTASTVIDFTAEVRE